MVEAHAIFQGLDNEEKTNIAHHESTILRLNDESFHLVGLGHESEENELIADNKISLRKIEFHIDDPVLIERQLMVNEAFRNLNNAEKKCLEDGFAAIVFRKGYYCLIFDSVRYPEYVSKYGTECKSCDELQNERQVKKEVS